MELEPINKQVHVTNRFRQLIAIDKIRYYKILEILQYTVLYCFLGFFFAIVTNRISHQLFTPFDETKEGSNYEDILYLLLEVTVQICFISICIFYIIKIVKIIPLFFKHDHIFKPYTTTAYAGGIALSFMFLKMQPYLSDKLEFIMHCIMKKTGTRT